MLLTICLFSYVVEVDCVWGEYDKWSTCSATCGGGSRTRIRIEATPSSNGGASCTGSATETGTCNPNACPGSKPLKAMPKQILNTGAYFSLEYLVLILILKYYELQGIEILNATQQHGKSMIRNVAALKIRVERGKGTAIKIPNV